MKAGSCPLLLPLSPSLSLSSKPGISCARATLPWLSAVLRASDFATFPVSPLESMAQQTEGMTRTTTVDSKHKKKVCNMQLLIP